MDMVKLASPEEISLLPKTSWNIHQPAEGDVREEALSTGKCVGVRIDVLRYCQTVMRSVMFASVGVIFPIEMNLYFIYIIRHLHYLI